MLVGDGTQVNSLVSGVLDWCVTSVLTRITGNVTILIIRQVPGEVEMKGLPDCPLCKGSGYVCVVYRADFVWVKILENGGMVVDGVYENASGGTRFTNLKCGVGADEKISEIVVGKHQEIAQCPAA